ncbi:MAG: zinc-binding alcohol dehydrogenase family protein [Rhodobacteraceae bacterium]|jgi:propanol-preferring alcohol dehydrogenase|nr:zinc-binding alcohol dehydrogenase family protein [Paracoccaceae bacterium]
MRAMLLDTPGTPLRAAELALPPPGPGEVALAVEACGVCRTDLHLVDGDLPGPRLPVIPGHEIVGRVTACGPGVAAPAVGARVGVPWLGSTCGHCRFCATGRENLCLAPGFTGYTRDGGFAEGCIARADACVPLPEGPEATTLAPLLCAGLIGWRALRLAGEGRRIGLYGFGAAAHIIAQIARAQGREVFAFTRPGDAAAQAFARRLGCAWAGDSDAPAPAPLDAALIFAPVGALVPLALKAVDRGGRVVCAGIHMSDIPGFPYADLWHEREIRSVANLTRADAAGFMPAATAAGVRTAPVVYPLAAANLALEDLRAGRFQGAAVLVP